MNAEPRLPGTIQTIPEALGYWATRTPNAIALLAPGREPTTYSELAAAVERLAGELRSLGLGRGDGIALIFPEGPDLCLALLAAMTAGIAVPLAWPSPEAERQKALASARVRAAVVSTAIPPPELEHAGQGCPVIMFATGSSGRIGDVRLDGEPVGEPVPAIPPDPEDIALILHSSGTTGRPKLIPRLHRGLVSSCRNIIEARAATAADRCLGLSRTAYAQGSTDLLVSVFVGGSLVSVPGLDISAMPRWLRDYRPTWVSTTPAVLRTLAADRGEPREALRQAPLRYISSRGGPLSTDEAQWLESALGVQILNGYGMSEASMIAGGAFRDANRPLGSIGLPRCEIRICSENGEPLANGVTGEIAVRGPRVFPGYLDDPEANAVAFLPGGWFRTGDLGFLDRAGYLHLTGRLGEIINRGGEKIAPHDVDVVLLTHPAVAEAAAFGVPDTRLGEDIVAAVVLTPDAAVSPRALRRWLATRLSQYKVPRRIWFVESLPRTRTGKVQRAELARMWGEAHR